MTLVRACLIGLALTALVRLVAVQVLLSEPLAGDSGLAGSAMRLRVLSASNMALTTLAPLGLAGWALGRWRQRARIPVLAGALVGVALTIGPALFFLSNLREVVVLSTASDARPGTLVFLLAQPVAFVLTCLLALALARLVFLDRRAAPSDP